MEEFQVPQDDVADVADMVEKIEAYAYEVLDGNERCLALSAMMSVAINFMLNQSETFQDMIDLRSLFIRFMDAAIKSTRTDGK